MIFVWVNNVIVDIQINSFNDTEHDDNNRKGWESTLSVVIIKSSSCTDFSRKESIDPQINFVGQSPSAFFNWYNFRFIHLKKTNMEVWPSSTV